MKKSYLSTILKATNFQQYPLFRILFIVFFSIVFFNVRAQCPIASARASVTTICSGTIAAIELSANQAGTTYSWTIVQEGIVGAAEGTGSRIAQTLTATEALTGSVVYTITPLANGCKGVPSSVKITVNPIPVVIATPSNSTIVSNSAPSIALTSDAAETAFSWTVIQSGVTGARTGSGSVINQTLTTGAEKGIATYRIIPNLKGCAGEPVNAKVIVKR